MRKTGGVKKLIKTAMEYTKEIGQAILINIANGCNLYLGKEGCLRLAKEYGYGLKDYPEKERRDAMQSSYSIICVKGYNLKPPVDAKEWVKAIESQFIY